MGQAHRGFGLFPNIVFETVCRPGRCDEICPPTPSPSRPPVLAQFQNGVGARLINNAFKIYLSQSWINCQSEHEAAEASRPDGAKQKKKKISSESNGIHVAVWNMCSGWALIRRSSTSPRRSLFMLYGCLEGKSFFLLFFFFLLLYKPSSYL